MSEVLVLKKRKDFVRVAKQGLKMVTSTIILQATQTLSEDKNPPHVGYTTTKKIGKAHVRNRTRRRMRAAVREVFAQYALKNTDYVLIGRYNTATCPFTNLTKDLAWGLKKISKIIQEEGKSNEEINLKLSDSTD